MSTVPVRLKSPLSEQVSAEFLEVPEKACPGDLVMFSIRTTPGNQCEALFFYQVGDKQKSQDLTTHIADSEGICEWQWRIPRDASPNGASVYNVIRFGDQEHNSLPPKWIEIIQCE